MPTPPRMPRSIGGTMRWLQSITILAVAILPSTMASSSLYSTSQFVQAIEDQSSFENFMNDNGIWLMQFCSSQSAKCKNTELTTQYDALATISRGLYNIGYIDISTDDGKAMGEVFDIRGGDAATKIRPTFLLFGDDRQNPTPYKGVQDAQNMLNAIMETALETLQVRARGGGPPPPKSGGGGSTSSSGRSNSRRASDSKVLQLTSDNFEQEILNSPLVSAVACKYSNRVLYFYLFVQLCKGVSDSKN